MKQHTSNSQHMLKWKELYPLHFWDTRSPSARGIDPHGSLQPQGLMWVYCSCWSHSDLLTVYTCTHKVCIYVGAVPQETSGGN